MLKYYVRLNNNEYKIIQKIILKSNLINILELNTNVNFGDYFYDVEKQSLIPFFKGLELLKTNIDNNSNILNIKEKEIIKNIYNKFQIKY